MKTYKNKKLNITIENPRFFEILEHGGRVELKVDSQILYKIFPNSRIYAHNSSTIWAFDSSTVETHNSSAVEAFASSAVEAFDSSTIRARDSSTVEAYGSSTIRAYGSSTIRACGFSCVFIKSISAKIKPKNHYGAVIKQVFKTRKTTIVYKKLRDGLIAELEIPKGQVFLSANHGKCRTASAKVLSITSIDKKQTFTEGASNHNPGFVYIVGETVNTEYFEGVEECAPGIHFFLSREEAVNYESRT